MLGAGLGAPWGVAQPCAADEEAPQSEEVEEPTPKVDYGTVVDPTLAYQFAYPLQTLSGRRLPLVFSREPVRYSSAAPLSADARQRIVSELVDLADGITVSVSVGPASGALENNGPDQWAPEEVARSVLADRSTARKPTGERVPLSTVESIETEQREGQVYWVYEHVSQGSPTVASRARETFRHSVAVTSWRPGVEGEPYLYTLNLSCPQVLWKELGPLYRAAASSFKLTPPTQDYVAPGTSPFSFF